MIPGLFDATMQRLSYGLDGLSQRQQIIADNIANVDTPGYLTHDIPFEQQLLDAMNNPLSGSAVPGSLPDAITRNDLQVRNDGNNVDINMQMNEMTGTAVTYEAATQLISQKFGMLSDVLAPIN
jgi:flagellar basal-body rod protein FlgB